MFWLLFCARSLSKLRYLVCFHNEAKSLIKMASFRESAEYQAKEKTKKPPKPKTPHARGLIEINALWECKSKRVKKCYTK